MTVIVGALTPDGITLAADGQTTEAGRRFYGTVPKLWVDKGYAFGAAGSLRLAQVIRHHVAWPTYDGPGEDGDWESFLVRHVVPAIRKGVKGHGVLGSGDASDGHSLPGELVIATGHLMAEIGGNGSVFVDSSGRLATGSGCAEALGAMGDEGPWDERQVVEAVRRVGRVNLGVSGDISVVNTTTLTVRTVAA